MIKRNEKLIWAGAALLIVTAAALAALSPLQRGVAMEILLTQSLGPTYLGNGKLASKITLCSPMGLAINHLGELLISDRGNGLGRVIWRIDEVGEAHVLAGSGRAGPAPPGPADQISFTRPDGLAVAEDGSVYVADGFQHTVYRISSAGVVTAAAGTGKSGYSGDGGPATRARLSRPADIRVSRDGELFIADVQNHSVRHVDAFGRITTIVGTGQPGFSPDGSLASEASLNSPWGIALDRQGLLVISDSENHRVRRVEHDGRLSTIAGNGAPGYTGDGGSAVRASLNSPQGLFVDHDGRILIVDEHNHVIRLVDLSGVITTIVGTGVPGRASAGTPALNAALDDPESVLINVRGEVIFADGNNFRVLKFGPDGTVQPLVGDGDRRKCRTLKARIRTLLTGP